MLKKWISIAFFIFLVSGLLECDSGGDGDTASGDTKYLAENIIFSDGSSLASRSLLKKDQKIFNFNLIPEVYAQSSDIDRETQIYAQNVIFESSATSQIESDNVQDALEEISLTLSSVIVGTWDIQNYHQEDLHYSTGRIIIYDDGTFNLVEGSFAAVGMGSGKESNSSATCGHTEENQTYDIYTEELMAFNHVNEYIVDPMGSTAYVENTALPRLVKLRQEQIIFIGSGGCGKSGRERISILTRVE